MSDDAGRPCFVDPHIHMTSRTTDDYRRMAEAGVRAVIEPAFWTGQPRTGVDTFRDYFAALTGWERFRASQFGIRHFCAIGLNAKEANDERLADAVLEILPLHLGKEGVVAVGEIGFDDQSAAEERAFRAQLDLAREADLPVMIHTPHRDKKRGTGRSMDLCVEHGLDPARVVVDHNNEETVDEVRERGFWAAFTIYPRTKMGSRRMVEIVRRCGAERIIVDSSADWGISDPLAVPRTARLMLEEGIPPATVRAVTCDNALAVYGGRPGDLHGDWLAETDDMSKAMYAGSTVLRGQDPGELGEGPGDGEIV